MCVSMENKKVEWVSDIIGEKYKSWEPGQVVTISAQTGTGKTNFILNCLLPFAVENNRKILYLCNRTALVEQIQKELLQNNIPYDGMKKGRKRASPQEQKEAHIKVISYQKSEFISVETEICKFGAYYCVFDEAHYYYQDAQLNANTQKISSYLFQGKMGRIFSKCVNVFISATSDYVYLLLEKYYGKDFTSNLTTDGAEDYLKKIGVHNYSTVSDYSYLIPYYFSDHREIVDAIISTPQEEKWLVFMSSLKKAEEFLKSLNAAGYRTVHTAKETEEITKSCAIVSSKTKNSYTYKELIESEKFSCRVLLATSVIDNGVNIHDPALKHIVVPAVMKTQFLQLIGRKRINRQSDERVNLYLQGFQKNSVNAFLRIAKKKMQFIDDFNHRNDLEKYKNRYLRKLERQEISHEAFEEAEKNNTPAVSDHQQNLLLALKANPGFRNLLAIKKNNSYLSENDHSLGKMFPELEINMLAEFQIGLEEKFYEVVQGQLKDIEDEGAVKQQQVGLVKNMKKTDGFLTYDTTTGKRIYRTIYHPYGVSQWIRNSNSNL